MGAPEAPRAIAIRYTVYGTGTTMRYAAVAGSNGCKDGTPNGIGRDGIRGHIRGARA
jgi:hypothetical protein